MSTTSVIPLELLAQGGVVLVLWLAVRRFATGFSRQLSGLRQACPPTFTPTAPPVRGLSGVHELPLGSLEGATHSWGQASWNTQRLRDGPDYKRNRIKRLALPPLLPCVGFDAFRTERKIFTDCSEAQAACLPAEVREAARDGGGAAGLPRFLVVSVNMPAYSGPAADGPTLKFVVYFAVPPSLAAEPSGAAKLLRAFLNGAASGHRAPGGEFYDRFKVIARMVREDRHSTNSFLRMMIDQFNGKPMLWRFFGVWGDCGRRGAVATVNLDFCTGGRIKNGALAQCASRFDGFVGDVSWLLESRTDAEMPERLIGGVVISRIDVTALPMLAEAADGALRLTYPNPSHSSAAAVCTGTGDAGSPGMNGGKASTVMPFMALPPGKASTDCGPAARGAAHGRSNAWWLWVAHLEVLAALLLLVAIAAQPESQKAVEWLRLALHALW